MRGNSPTRKGGFKMFELIATPVFALSILGTLFTGGVVDMDTTLAQDNYNGVTVASTGITPGN